MQSSHFLISPRAEKRSAVRRMRRVGTMPPCQAFVVTGYPVESPSFLVNLL
jgi:hypothetical protein